MGRRGEDVVRIEGLSTAYRVHKIVGSDYLPFCGCVKVCACVCPELVGMSNEV